MFCHGRGTGLPAIIIVELFSVRKWSNDKNNRTADFCNQWPYKRRKNKMHPVVTQSCFFTWHDFIVLPGKNQWFT
jgi:hypothetical protein